MDQFLAEYYNTGAQEAPAYSDDDLEKMAQLTLLTKEAAAEGVDLSQFSDDELLGMADELYGGGYEGDLEKQAAVKFEEADYLGRVMAHSFNQELGNIEKEAGWVGDTASKGWKAIKEIPTRVGSRLVTKGEKRRLIGQELKKAKGQEAVLAKQSPYESVQQAGPNLRAARRKGYEAATKEVARKARFRGGMALGGAGALAAGGAGAGIYAGTRKDKRSSDSAFDQLVEERAYEHLEAAGLLEKQAEGDFETTVDRAALELLEANGYPVEWY